MRLPSSTSIAAAVVPATGWLRIGLGGGLLALPWLLARVLGVDAATARRTEWLGRMVGGREVALGIGTLVGPPRPWLTAQMVSDATDAVALVAARRHGQVQRWLAAGVIVFAGAGIAAELVGIVAAPEK